MKINLEAIGITSADEMDQYAPASQEAFELAALQCEVAIAHYDNVMSTFDTIETLATMAKESGTIDDQIISMFGESMDVLTGEAFSAKDVEATVEAVGAKLKDAGKKIVEFLKMIGSKIAEMFKKFFGMFKVKQTAMMEEAKRVAGLKDAVYGSGKPVLQEYMVKLIEAKGEIAAVTAALGKLDKVSSFDKFAKLDEAGVAELTKVFDTAAAELAAMENGKTVEAEAPAKLAESAKAIDKAFAKGLKTLEATNKKLDLKMSKVPAEPKEEEVATLKEYTAKVKALSAIIGGTMKVMNATTSQVTTVLKDAKEKEAAPAA